MTITTTEPRVTYAGDGSTTAFSITFDFLSTDTSEVRVELITDSTNNVVLQTDPTNYSISGTTVTMVSAPASGETLVLSLNVAESQTTDYVANDTFPAETHEAALDKLTRLIKQVKAEVDNNCLKLPTNKLTSTTVTDTDIGASKIFRMNSSADGVELATVNSITNGGDSWSDAVDSSLLPDTDSTYDIGASGNEFVNIYGDNLYGTLGTAAQTNITSLGTLTTLTVDNITINGNDISSGSGDITFSPTGICDFSANTDHMVVPIGTTAQRDTSDGAGSLRWNSTDGKLEAYSGSGWVQYTSAGGPGAWSDPIDSAITVDTDSTYDIGTTGARLLNLYADNLYGSIAEAAQTNITSLGTLTTLTVDNITINGNDISSGSGDITLSPTGIVDITASTDHLLPPTGTTAQRTGYTAGEFRYNSSDNKLEYYNGSSWQQLTEGSAGALVFLESQTASASASLDLTTTIDSTYDHYVIFCENLIPATDGAHLWCRVSTDTGSTFKSGASDYNWLVSYRGTAVSDTADSELTISAATGIGNAAGESGFTGEIHIWSPSNSSIHTQVTWNGGYKRSDSLMSDVNGSGVYSATTAVDAAQVLMSSGNISSGTVRLYGVSKS
jgi:hypothetical protein